VEGPDFSSSNATRNGSEDTPAEPTETAVRPEQAPADETVPETPRPPARKKRRKRLVIVTVAILLVLVGAGAGGAYLVRSSQFVSTDNAQIDGDQIQVNAPATGTLVDWQASKGKRVHKGEVLGRIKMQGSGAQPQRTIRSPGNGTFAVVPGVEGSWETAGTNLATAYDFSKIYATARVDETDVGDVHPGALVDIDVDAYPDATVTGIVQEVQGSAAGVFSLFPESNSTGNFQKVTQVVPVKIALASTGGAEIAPGMNITVHIHKH
jgi:multidrug resistance efflux pump